MTQTTPDLSDALATLGRIFTTNNENVHSLSTGLQDTIQEAGQAIAAGLHDLAAAVRETKTAETSAATDRVPTDEDWARWNPHG